MIPLDADELGEGALRRLITKSTQFLMGHSSAIFCADPEQLAKTRSASRNPLGVRVLTLAHLSLPYLESLAIPRLLHLRLRVARLAYGTGQPLNNNHDCWVN